MEQHSEPGAVNAPLARLDSDAFAVERAGFSTGDLIAILKLHRYLFLSIFFSVVAVGVLYVFGSHKKYVSTMELMVQNARSNAVISAGRQEAPASTQEVTEEELGSEVQLIQSADVLDEVVDPGWSSIPADQHSAADLAKHEQAITSLRNNLIVAPVKLSHVFTVQLTTRSPYDSNHKLNRMLASFLSEKRRISHPSGASTMFAQEADAYKAQWATAQDELATFQQSHQIVSVSGQQELIQKEMLIIDEELRDSDVAIAEARKKMDGDRSELASLPRRLSTRETNIPASGSIDQMYSKLNELTIQRTDLLAKYRPDDRLVKAVEDKINDVQAALKDSRTLRSSETTTDINPTWQVTNQDLSETSARVTGLVGRQKALQAQLVDLHAKLSAVTQGSQSFNALQQKAAELDANYQLYSQKRDEAKMAEVMDEHQLLNVALIQTPTFSSQPASPKPLLDILLTIVTGLFLASFAVFFVHSNSLAVSSERELHAISRYPTLSSVPARHSLKGRQESA